MENMNDIVSKFEKKLLGWSKNVPHLPTTGQKWLGDNVWWIALIGAIAHALAFLVTLNGLLVFLSVLGSPNGSYYITGNFTSLAIMHSSINMTFYAVIAVLLGFAVKPLQGMKKKGWVLLFFTLLVTALSVVVGAILSFSVSGFIVEILFGAIVFGLAAYFITEIHGQFGHTPKKKSKRVSK